MNKKYKLLYVFIILFAFVIFSTIAIKADTGPKSYVTLEIEGDTNGYYLTLLSKSSQYGPYSSEYNYDIDVEESIDLKFASYVDSDGFYYLHYYGDISDGEFSWSYYPPLIFKILIYDSINDRFITNNEIYERASFSTVLKVIVNEDGFNKKPFEVEKSNNYIKKVILGFLTRLCICLIIEVLVAICFKLKKKQLLVVGLANLVTQIVLNMVLAIIIYNSGYNLFLIVPVYIFIEILILFVEWGIYVLLINKVNKNNIKSSGLLLLYSFVSNMASFVLGYIILSLLGF